MTEIYIFNIAKLAVKSIMNVNSLYPKPGLITPLDNSGLDGANFFDINDAAMALFQSLVNSASVGIETENIKPEDSYMILKNSASIGQQDVLRATRGRIKFRGHIFLLGLICAAAGKLIAQKRNLTPGALILTASAYIRGIVEKDLWSLNENENSGKKFLSPGQKSYITYGIEGCRGEADKGFPNVLEALRLINELEATHGHLELRERLIHVLINIMSTLEDTYITAHNGIAKLLNVQKESAKIIKSGGMLTSQGMEMIFNFDRTLRAEGIYPGGSDLILTTALFLKYLSALKLTRSGYDEN